ncbi:MAG: hypothetical protein ABJG88_07400 [Litorimonas sp.]
MLHFIKLHKLEGSKRSGGNLEVLLNASRITLVTAVSWRRRKLGVNATVFHTNGCGIFSGETNIYVTETVDEIHRRINGSRN